MPFQNRGHVIGPPPTFRLPLGYLGDIDVDPSALDISDDGSDDGSDDSSSGTSAIDSFGNSISSALQSIAGAAPAIAGSVLTLDAQKQLNTANAQRIAMGLPPLTAAQAGINGPTFGVGLTGPTLTAASFGGVGLLLLIGFGIFMATRK